MITDEDLCAFQKSIHTKEANQLRKDVRDLERSIGSLERLLFLSKNREKILKDALEYLKDPIHELHCNDHAHVMKNINWLCKTIVEALEKVEEIR